MTCFMTRSLTAAFVALLTSAAFAQPISDDRSIFDLQAGSTFTLKQDIFINRGENFARIDGSRKGATSQCFLQTYFSKSVDRVVRTGRVLTLKSVALTPNYFALTIDDGREDHVLAQIGCNLAQPGWIPSVGDVRLALEHSFDLDLKDIPVEEVSLPLEN